jgi:thiol-disulfide isomerase/thioredoxin
MDLASTPTTSEKPLGGKAKRHTYKKRRPFVVGKVHAKWCGHCQSLKPEWSKMKGILKKRKHGIQYVEIEDTQKQEKFAEVKQKYGVELKADAYPTLFKIEDDKLSYYEGQRTAEQMADWYANSSSQKQDHNGFFRGAATFFGGSIPSFKSLYEMRRRRTKSKQSNLQNKNAAEKRSKRKSRRRGFFW